MKLYPKIVTGTLNAHNKDACDWGWQGYLAYGCQNLVTVVEPKTVQTIQVLDKHRGVVTQVKWAHENYHHDLNSPYTLRLASSDSHGHIVVWDVGLGLPRSEFMDGSKPLMGMKWLSNQDTSRDLLVCLHPPYNLILWNADTGTKLWKKSYTETLLTFTFDPFNCKNLAFLGQDCIIFVNDFTINKTPSSNGKKFYISNPGQGKMDASAMSRSSSSGSLERKQSSTSLTSSKNLAKRMSKILIGESKPKTAIDEESVTLNECLQLCFHQSCRHHLMLLYTREMLILDLEINQTVGIIAIDRASSSFSQVIPCWQRDMLIFIHENGGVSVRVRRRNNSVSTPAPEGHGAFDDTPTQLSMEVAYDLRCQSDPLRVTRHNKLYGAAICPMSEKVVSLMMSDSRVLLWELTAHPIGPNGNEHSFVAPLLASDWDVSWDEKLAPSGFPIKASKPHPQMTLADTISTAQILDSDQVSQAQSVQLKFLLTGLTNGVSAHVTVVRMCPPLTNKNMDIYQPLVAIGNHMGSVQVVNAASGQIDREYSLHSGPVRGVEWCGLKSFLSYSYPIPGTSALVKNEIIFLDITSGKQELLRGNRDNESPIEMLAVSHLKQYFVLMFKDKPLELWDLRSQTVIRELPRNFPRPTAVVWSPSHSLKTLRKKLLDDGEDVKSSSMSASTSSSSSNQLTTSGDSVETKEKKGGPKSNVREHFVMTDKDGTVYHFIVEGTAISDVTKIPPESGLARITALSWKGDNLIFGDSEGFQCLWDLKAKISRTTPTNRGWVKKVRFAPGRDNMKFFTLHNDGVLIWEIGFEGKSTVLHSIKSPKDISKVVDIDWAGSDRPALITANNALHICDITLKAATSSIEHWDLSESVFSPHLLPARLSQIIKCVLQHQRWRPQYSLALLGLLDHDRPTQKKIAAQIQLIDKEITDYLPMCKFGTAHRCLLVARLFGDESEVHFWTVALHYLRSLRANGLSKEEPLTELMGEGDGATASPDQKSAEASGVCGETKAERSVFRDQPLERCFDSLCDNKSFKKYQLDRVQLQDSKRATMEHTQKCADSYVQLGQTDRAVQLLLETEAEAGNYYIDCLKACLVASVRSSGASQSTIKLVATNLIANGHLTEGVQLLCLINKGLDACRYLQTYSSWDHAVWLAKASLEPAECSEVMRRWAEYLNSPQVNQKRMAVLVSLSLGQFTKVLELLYSMRNFDRAALFLEACQEFKLISKTEASESLFEAIYLEYARYLINLGLGTAAKHYCTLAGDKGQQLLLEVDILFSSN